EVVYRRNAVAVLIRDPKTDTLLFTKQLRAGAYIQAEPWIYEMVAGLIDEDEDKITALKREVKEEAGIEKISNIKEISQYYPSCGGCSEKVFLYYAEADLSQ
ncbi:NUDIX hydrolase, partial [Escherichia coli]|nr:NUDIX hydrolase [Escherichia coli]EJO9115037.1 NUDIX hydrolase [Escherichia coli]